MKKVSAFAPANISCIFKIYPHKNPRWMGSFGVGFTLNEGVLVTATKAKKNAVFFNGKKIIFPPVDEVMKKLAKESVEIYIDSKLPLGSGFGLSGASALATAYALNTLFFLKKSKKTLAIIAHTAEVTSKTGLGDVTNQYYGGFFLKTKPSSQFIVQKIPLKNIPVYCATFSKLSTNAVLTDQNLFTRINTAAAKNLQEVQALLKMNKKIAFGDIITISKQFAVESGLLTNKKVIEQIETIQKNNGHASMIMLGNAVFSDTSFPGSTKLFISDKGAHLL